MISFFRLDQLWLPFKSKKSKANSPSQQLMLERYELSLEDTIRLKLKSKMCQLTNQHIFKMYPRLAYLRPDLVNLVELPKISDLLLSIGTRIEWDKRKSGIFWTHSTRRPWKCEGLIWAQASCHKMQLIWWECRWCRTLSMLLFYSSIWEIGIVSYIFLIQKLLALLKIKHIIITI